MRVYFSILALCAGAAVLCVGLLISNSNLRETITRLEMQIAILNKARTADETAIRISNEARDYAAKRARERLDALQIPADASDNDILDACRGSLCPQSGTKGANSALGSPDSVPSARQASQPDAR